MSGVCLTWHWRRQHGRTGAASEGCRAAIIQAASTWLQPRALARVQESVQQLLEPHRHCAVHQAAVLLSAFSAAARTAMVGRVRQ